MLTAARRTSVTMMSGGVALAAVLAGQASYTVRRRDLPSVSGADATGIEHGHVPDARPLRLAAAGDSTLTGPGLADESQIWVRQAARMLAGREGRPVDVHSVAVGGSRVRDVLRDQLEPLLAGSPDIAVIAVGTNDALHYTPLVDVERSFRELVGRLLAEVPAVVIGGVGDLGGIARVPFPLSAAIRAQGRRVNRVIRSVVVPSDAHYIDVSTVDRAFRRGGASLFSADLFHPNEHGHALWAGAAAPVIAHAARSISRG
jgi:lysophospholipase L1-like esterase